MWYNKGMRVHSDEKIKRLKEMREAGASINVICEELSMPKTTVWHHVQGVHVSAHHRKLLRSKQGGGRARTKKNWEIAGVRANNLLTSPHRELSIAAAMLYWAEGTKAKSCNLVNSDERMIKLYLKFLRKAVKIPPINIRAVVRTYGSINCNQALDYWLEITKIPNSAVTLRHDDGGTSTTTKHGLCRVIVGKGGADTLKLMHSLVKRFLEEQNVSP